MLYICVYLNSDLASISIKKAARCDDVTQQNCSQNPRARALVMKPYRWRDKAMSRECLVDLVIIELSKRPGVLQL